MHTAPEASAECKSASKRNANSMCAKRDRIASQLALGLMLDWANKPELRPAMTDCHYHWRDLPAPRSAAIVVAVALLIGIAFAFALVTFLAIT